MKTEAFALGHGANERTSVASVLSVLSGVDFDVLTV
jgi:hypothetical protein